MKIKSITTLFALFLVVTNAFGQVNALYSAIQDIKKSNVQFENVIVKEADADVSVLTKFINPDEVFFFEHHSLYSNNERIKALSLTIPLKSKIMVLELIEVSDEFYSYNVTTSDGKKYPANKGIMHYRGVVKDNSNSLVAVTFSENEIFGLVCTNDGNFNIIKDKQTGTCILYNENNLKEKKYPECGTVDDSSFSYHSEVLLRQSKLINEQKAGAISTMIGKNVNIYFETEYDIYQTLGSVSSVETFISGLFNQVAILYLNEDIDTSISQINIWTSTDPYTGTNTSSLLQQFQTTRTSINGDLGMLLTFRDVGGGEAAGFEGLCNSSTSQKLAVAMLYNDYNNFPTYSWSVFVVTHEFGHLFGSRHTHACVWNGNNTAIDGCAGYVEGSCPLPGYPAGGGTIMSYCHFSGRPGVVFNLGFGSQPGNVIRNSVANAGCLQSCVDSYTNQTVTTNTTVTGCNNLNVQNVTVTSNAKLTLNAPGEVFINGMFEVALGSELEIK